MESNTKKPQICLVILMGLPGVGKTTFSEHLQLFLDEKVDADDIGVVNHCYDKVVSLDKQKKMALSARRGHDESSDLNSEQNFKISRKKFLTIGDKIICKLLGDTKYEDCTENSEEMQGPRYHTLSDKNIVLLVIDDNNYYESMRHEYYQIARNHKVGFCQIYLKPNCIETVLSNNDSRPEGQKIPHEVITKMNAKIEPPNPFQNSWEQFSFTINVSNKASEDYKTSCNMETCLNVIKVSLNNPVEPLPPTPPDKTEDAKAKSRAVNSTNVCHKSDKILRKILNKRMRESMEEENTNIAQLGQRLNDARAKLLEDLKKSPESHIPSDILTVLTGQQEAEEVRVVSANEELERVIAELFEFKLNSI